jgi:anti-sigma B factor antagonist
MAIQVAVPDATSADDLVARLAFSVKREELGGRRYAVALAGEVDMQTAPEFERELLATIEQGARELVIDLTSASFIDSSFVHVLLDGQRRLRSCGGRLSIVCGDRNLVRVFEITGLDRIFSIHSPLERHLTSARRFLATTSPRRPTEPPRHRDRLSGKERNVTAAADLDRARRRWRTPTG